MNPAIWLARAAHLYPDDPALFLGRKLIATYAGLAGRVAALAGALVGQHGIAPGDRVAVFMANCSAYLEVLYGAWHAGAAVLPINPKLHPREVAWILEHAEAKLVFASGDQAAALAEAGIELSPGCSLIHADRAEYRTLFDHAPMPDPAARGRDDLGWLFYTSGTTGRPKGVMITCGNLQAMAMAYFIAVDAVRHEDAMLYAAPMSHGAGLYNFMFVMRGARHIIPESGGFDAGEITELTRHHRNVCMFAAPTMLRRLIGDAAGKGYRGDGIKTIVYGGGPMYLADILAAVDAFGPRFVQIYGQGESPMTITALSREHVADRTHPHWRGRLGSVGTPQDCVEIRIADGAGNAVPPGQIGEILVRGPQVMAGYWRNADATLETLRDGWLWTGDMGSMDEDGFLTLQDRSKDVIISGGSNIYPREVEEVLLSHDGVAEVCVIGRPDPDWGEAVVAFVVREQSRPVDDAALDRLCLDHIARFKRPKDYVFVPSLPKNAYGKVLKTELRQRLGEFGFDVGPI